MRDFVTGLGLALSVLPAQLVAARILEFVPAGTRAQAAGACIASLTVLAAGVALGLINHRRHAARALGAAEAGAAVAAVAHAGPQAHRELLGMVLDEVEEPMPWVAMFTAAFVLAGSGVVGFYSGAGHVLLPAHTLETGGVARAIFATDAIVLPALLLLALGTLLGISARPWTMLTSLVGLALLAGLAAAGVTAAEYSSYDPLEVRAYQLAAIIVAGLVTGFVISAARRRLAFVELTTIALAAGYGVYVAAAVGPRELIASYNVPEEQVLLALVLAPAMGLLILLTVGGSVGFLLLGGGKLDAGFGYEVGVALRYLKPTTVHRRVATGFSIGGVCLGVTALIVVLSVMSGFEDDLKQKILGAHAHIVLGKHGDDFEEYEAVEQRVRTVDGVRSAAAFLLGDAMVSSDVGLSGTLVKGIDPREGPATDDLRRNIEKGALEHLLTPELIPGARSRVRVGSGSGTSTTGAGASGAPPGGLADPFELLEPALRAPEGGKVLPGIIIGRELSKTLRAYVGDTLKLVSPVSEEIGPTGPHPKLRRFRVAGIFYSGMYEYDAKFTYIDMKQAQSFFGKRGKVTGVELKVADVDDTGRIVETLRRFVGGFPYTVKDWRTMNKELFSALLLEKLAMFIILTFIILVASLTIVATLVMIVLEKGKEIAILKSIGANDASIMKIFIVQGLVVGIGGAALGLALGVGLCLFIQKFGLPLDQRVFYIERLPVVMSWAEITVITISAVVISYLATIYPAMRAASLKPVEGLRDD